MADQRSRTFSSILALAFTVVMLVAPAGCADGDDETTDTSSNGTTTDDAGSGGSTDVSTDDSGSDPGSGGSTNDLAEGSGCTPGTETGLPDGRWYGLIEVVDDRRVDFDLACRFTGDAAVAAAAEDGEESPPPNDYYVRNVNTLVRTLEVAGGAMVTWYPDVGDPDSGETVSFDDWLIGRENRQTDLAVWIETSDGEITVIEEQWVP